MQTSDRASLFMSRWRPVSEICTTRRLFVSHPSKKGCTISVSSAITDKGTKQTTLLITCFIYSNRSLFYEDVYIKQIFLWAQYNIRISSWQEVNQFAIYFSNVEVKSLLLLVNLILYARSYYLRKKCQQTARYLKPLLFITSTFSDKNSVTKHNEAYWLLSLLKSCVS